MRGWIVKNTYEFATLPDVINLNYSGQTGITITNIATADATYVLVNKIGQAKLFTKNLIDV